ncbi:hypothetical protein KP509_05G033000 [Ceratopteris richardii]|uniref:Bifunctional inhibitor/plant lipid transfer protein/seed storage helical domain-containing protein n=1 Tax=Ceratopteris richardii TaxID=49495 RepID=A0A8T2UXD8_CERRI|nr:hypothetical protein KP509_05G033000 [Ceratopteris richardii]
MRFVTQTSVSVLLALCLVVLQRATMALPTQGCINSFSVAATPCDADPKSAACCTALGAMFSSYPTCLCDVIATVLANNPNYQLNRTKLREMIVQCALDVSASDTSCLPPLGGASPPTVAPPTTPGPPPPSTTTISPPTAPVTPPPPAPEVADSSPPLPITAPSPPPVLKSSPPPQILKYPPPPPVLKSPPPPQIFEYPPPPPITRQSRSPPPPPPDSSLTMLHSPPPPPEPITGESPPSSIIEAVLRSGQYCISPNLNAAYYVAFALLGVLLY